ncbi:HEAT repeat domain-containing protein [Nostoc sp.]|uniref:HEAT repeat domain-containing protein n=1 Tax=Nostoc sp. TaxID=1180 RepID=UPI002FF35418
MPKHLLKKRSPFFIFPFILLLTLLLALPWASAKEQPKPKPQGWQINGIVAALDDGYDGVKKLAFDKFNEYDLKNLKSVFQKPEDIAQKAAKILKDKTVESPVRSRAASALGNLGEVAKPYVKDIADILKDKTVESPVRSSAASALGNLGEVAKPYVKDIADILKVRVCYGCVGI